jgi:hypothetical protein
MVFYPVVVLWLIVGLQLLFYGQSVLRMLRDAAVCLL